METRSVEKLFGRFIVFLIRCRQCKIHGKGAGIIAPAIVATFVSTAVAVVYCKVMDGKK